MHLNFKIELKFTFNLLNIFNSSTLERDDDRDDSEDIHSKKGQDDLEEIKQVQCLTFWLQIRQHFKILNLGSMMYNFLVP